MNRSRQLIHRSALPLLFLMLRLAMASPDLGLATDLPVYGGLGGNELRADCPKGSYLVGLAGRTGAWIDRIAPVCAPWLRGSQSFGAPSIGPPSFGASTGGQERQTICLDGGKTHAIQSWWIHLLRSDNHYVQFIQVYCTPVTSPVSANSGQRLDFGATPDAVEEMVTQGPFNSQPPFQACPAGEVAVGIRVRAGHFVDAVGLICGPVPARLGAPATKLPGPLVQAPPPATPMNPQAKNMRVPDDLFVITKPAASDRVPQGQLIVTATPPKVGATNVTELELRYLDAPPTQRNSYPYVTVFSVETAKLLQGYPVAQIMTGGYAGRWEVRARASMKAVPGPWSYPVQFQLVVTQPTQSQKQTPQPFQQAPLPSSSVTQAPSPSVGVAPAVVRPPTTSSQGTGASSLFVRPRGVEGKEGGDPPPASETKP